MNNIKDNIRAVDGDPRTLLKAKLLLKKQQLIEIASNIKFSVLIILNGFKF